jgi:hypothetical protein
MIALPGHIALIVPHLARFMVGPTELGIYQYEGEHRWKDCSGNVAEDFFYIGIWG